MSECACRWDESDEARVIASSDQCHDHREESDHVEMRYAKAMDYELDDMVIAVAGGRRVRSIVPADPYKDKRQ